MILPIGRNTKNLNWYFFFKINNFQKRSKSKEMGNLHIFNMSMRQGNEWEEFHTMGNIAILVCWLFFQKFVLGELF